MNLRFFIDRPIFAAVLSIVIMVIGLVAMEIPAIKAPISAESPRALAISARPRHQPIASRKMYS